jgi:hypothetical protein
MRVLSMSPTLRAATSGRHCGSLWIATALTAGRLGDVADLLRQPQGRVGVLGLPKRESATTPFARKLGAPALQGPAFGLN